MRPTLNKKSLDIDGVDGWIAVIDDEPAVRLSIARVFKANGIRAECFGSAEEYLHREPSGDPQCIVLDVELPGGMNGPDLKDRLAGEGNCPPIVFMTGQDEIRPALLLQSPELSKCLRKPFDMSRLLASVRPHLQTVAARTM